MLTADVLSDRPRATTGSTTASESSPVSQKSASGSTLQDNGDSPATLQQPRSHGSKNTPLLPDRPRRKEDPSTVTDLDIADITVAKLRKMKEIRQGGINISDSVSTFKAAADPITEAEIALGKKMNSQVRESMTHLRLVFGEEGLEEALQRYIVKAKKNPRPHHLLRLLRRFPHEDSEYDQKESREQ